MDDWTNQSVCHKEEEAELQPAKTGIGLVYHCSGDEFLRRGKNYTDVVVCSWSPFSHDQQQDLGVLTSVGVYNISMC